MKKVIFLFAVLTGVFNNGYSQIITIKNKLTYQPVQGAVLINHNPWADVSSNKDGQADITIFKGAAQIEIRSMGFKSITVGYDEMLSGGNTLFLEPVVFELKGTVVSATRWKQSSDNVPSRIASIQPEDIIFQNPQTAADMLGNTGEVYIQKSQQAGGSPMMRGFATNRLLYTVDGIRMNTAIYRSGNVQYVILLDPFVMESAEVAFGPGSVIYGSDAVGGVMSFQTLTPEFSYQKDPIIKGNAVARYSSVNNEKTAHFDVNVGWKKWAIVTSISHFNFGDLRMGSHGPDDYLKKYYVTTIDTVNMAVTNPDPQVQVPTGYSQINLLQKIKFKLNEKWNFQYGLYYSETSDYPRYDKLIELKNGAPKAAVWEYGPAKWMMNNVIATYINQHKLFDEMKIRLALQNNEESRIDRDFSGSKRYRLRNQKENVRAWSGNIDFIKSINKHHVFYGIEYVYDDVKSIGTAHDIRNGDPIPVDDRYAQAKWSSYAAYINYQYQLSKPLTLQAGARYNQYDVVLDYSRFALNSFLNLNTVTVTHGALVGNLGMIFKPQESWILSLNASTAFRAPNVDDLGKTVEVKDGRILIPNPDLQAEYAYNGEVNISKYFGDIFKFNVTGFYTYLDKALVRRPFKVNGQDSIFYDGDMVMVDAIQNAAYATAYGFQLGFDLQIANGLMLTQHLNYQTGVEETDDGQTSRTRHAPPTFGVTRITFSYQKLMMQLYSTYNAKLKYSDMSAEEIEKGWMYAKDADGNPYSPAWATLNFKVKYSVFANMELTAGLENITDVRYKPYASGLVAPGRNFFMAVKASF